MIIVSILFTFTTNYTSKKLPIAIIIGYRNENPEIHERKKDNVFWV